MQSVKAPKLDEDYTEFPTWGWRKEKGNSITHFNNESDLTDHSGVYHVWGHKNYFCKKGNIWDLNMFFNIQLF